MTKVYVISGMGVDERVFKYINFGFFDPVFIQWIAPLKNESIESYAKRLATNIKEENPIIIGLSFGGMIAVEIAKQIPVKQLILLASAKTKFELPPLFRLLGKLKIDKIVPAFIFKQINPFVYWLFGVQSKEDKALLKAIFKDSDAQFLSWAVHQILNWKNESVPQNYFHIHGNADRLLPKKYVQTNAVIEGGGHFMVLQRAKEIEELILKQLQF